MKIMHVRGIASNWAAGKESFFGCDTVLTWTAWLCTCLLLLPEASVHPTESNIQAESYLWTNASRFLNLARGHKLEDCVFFMFMVSCIADLY